MFHTTVPKHHNKSKITVFLWQRKLLTQDDEQLFIALPASARCYLSVKVHLAWNAKHVLALHGRRENLPDKSFFGRDNTKGRAVGTLFAHDSK